MTPPCAAETTSALTAAGMSAEPAAAKGALFARARAALPRPARIHWYVPGRIEFLGKHTDYAGGRSLLCAAERGLCMAAAPRDDDLIAVTALDRGERVEFPLAAALEPTAGHWSNYPMTVARRIARNFPASTGQLLRGADIAFASDLPIAAGMSSSSTLIIATFLALADINHLAARDEYQRNIPDPEALSEYLGTVENGQSFRSLAGDRGVGTFGGSQDHTAIMLSQPGRLVRYRFCPVQLEEVLPLPDDHVFVIASSGLVAEKTGAAMANYNRASEAVSAIVDLWRRATGWNDATLRAAAIRSPDAPDRLRDIIRRDAGSSGFTADELLDRLEQFLAECERIIPAAAEALRASRLDELGHLVDESQARSERLLKNQVPETIFLAAEARRLGAAAASAFGAGFGGSVWALVAHDRAQELCEQWEASYRNRFSSAAEQAAFFLTRSGPPAMRVG